jgi:hypothetical protein
MRASASRTFFALVDDGALMAYRGGTLGLDSDFERGGEASGVMGRSGDAGEFGSARYTSLHAPDPMGVLRPWLSVWMV